MSESCCDSLSLYPMITCDVPLGAVVPYKALGLWNAGTGCCLAPCKKQVRLACTKLMKLFFEGNIQLGHMVNKYCLDKSAESENHRMV